MTGTDEWKALLARLDERTSTNSKRLEEILRLLQTTYVHQQEFQPVKKIAYGLIATLLVPLIGAIVALVYKN